MSKFDLVVIGAGPGGYVAAIRAAQLGMKTACVDKGQALGGTCLNVGCIPSKCLLETSEKYNWLNTTAKEQGIHVQSATLDFEAIMQRKNQVVKGLTDSVANLFKHYKIERFEGEAQFQTPHQLKIGQESIEADHILLATGSEATPLPFIPFDEKKVLSSTGALALAQIPKTMLIIGAGVIGVEIASVYQRFGCQVTLIEMLESICSPMDTTISKMLLLTLKKQGLTFHLGAKVLSAEAHADGVTAKVALAQGNAKGEETFSAEVLLVAVGRRPYTQGLGLPQIGINTSPKGFVPVDSNFRTAVPHIYAIGDLIEGPMLAHRASDEGIAVAELLAGFTPKLNYLAIPSVVYTHPEAASVGMSESEARAAGLDLLVATSAMRGNARARCAGDVEGVVKVIGEKQSGRLIGLHILASHASEMIGEGVIAIQKQATVEEIARASHAHPTLCEAIKEAAAAALGRAIHQ